MRAHVWIHPGPTGLQEHLSNRVWFYSISGAGEPVQMTPSCHFNVAGSSLTTESTRFSKMTHTFTHGWLWQGQMKNTLLIW